MFSSYSAAKICLVFSSLIDIIQEVFSIIHTLSMNPQSVQISNLYTEYHAPQWKTVIINPGLASCAVLEFIKVWKKEHQQELALESFIQTIPGDVSGWRILFSFWKKLWRLQENIYIFYCCLGCLDSHVLHVSAWQDFSYSEYIWHCALCSFINLKC